MREGMMFKTQQQSTYYADLAWLQAGV